MLMAGLSAVEESSTSGFSHPYDRSVEMEQSSREAVSKEIHRFEFVALAAMLMAMAALGMDTMLVALPDIARTFRVIEENDRQLIVTTYLLGIAAGQPLYGPLSDRFGRKPVLAAGLAIFVLGSLLAFLAPSFGAILTARILQGFGAASPRVLVTAIVRDRFSGRDMARTMSFVMMIFIMVPIFAPTIGAGILHLLGPWHWIFVFLLLTACLVLAWMILRLPETRRDSDRMPISMGSLSRSIVTVVTNRQALGYTVAMGFILGTMMGYLSSTQQIFVDVYGLKEQFPLMFGSLAFVLAVAVLLNARLIGKLGLRKLSHAALIGYVAVCILFAVSGFPNHPPLSVFSAYMVALFLCFGLMVPNFNALAMEPLGHIAGMASSFVGFYTTAAGAIAGWLIGQAFDGTVRPLAIGFTILGVLALLTVLTVERGALLKEGESTGATHEISPPEETACTRHSRRPACDAREC
jgi:MFS transporter, DHA1 family, multidrug resistance protein